MTARAVEIHPLAVDCRGTSSSLSLVWASRPGDSEPVPSGSEFVRPADDRWRGARLSFSATLSLDAHGPIPLPDLLRSSRSTTCPDLCHSPCQPSLGILDAPRAAIDEASSS